MPNRWQDSDPRATVADFSERELIDCIRRQLPPPPDWLLVPIGDDAAVVEPERNRAEVLSVDCLVEGVHFDRRFVPPDAIGHRALAVNLSDLAAMGAAPRLALLSMVLPSSLPVVDFEGMAAGFAQLAAQQRVQLCGGNLTRSSAADGPLILDVTVIGTTKPRQALTRIGARTGDELYVTGAIGSAAAGLQRLRSAPMEPGSPMSGCVERYLRPEPRVRVGTLLARNRAATACMDLSDGLADAVRQVAEASGVGASIDADALPIEPSAREWFASHDQDPVAAALGGGDDYELLFAVRPRWRRRLETVRQHGRAPLTRIGVCTENRAMTVVRGGREEPLPHGFSHFQPR